MNPNDEDRWDTIARIIVIVLFAAFFGVYATKYR